MLRVLQQEPMLRVLQQEPMLRALHVVHLNFFLGNPSGPSNFWISYLINFAKKD